MCPVLKLRDKFVPVSAVMSKGKVLWISYKAAKLGKNTVFTKYTDKEHFGF